ncbi:MAG: ABC transporter substrate-binding protein [Spirochaetaceae bacterium]|nr:MAG: ABC transporter substrate-binding protein [Spirochaetaceae bacterium]
MFDFYRLRADAHVSTRSAAVLALVIGCVLLFGGFVACSEVRDDDTAPVESAGIEVIDSLGRIVRLEQPPQRIVLTGRSNIMLIDALYLFPEVSSRVVGVGPSDQGQGDFFAVLEPRAATMTRFGRTVTTEEILTVQPDLVVLKDAVRDSVGRPLETLGVTVLYLDLETPDRFERDILSLGHVLGQTDRAEELVRFYRDRIERVQTRVRAALTDAEPPRVLVLEYTDQAGSAVFRVAPSDWMQTQQVRYAGATPVWVDAATEPRWTPVSFEQIARWDADAIVLVSFGRPVDDVVETMLADPLWQNLRAVRDARLFGMPGDFVSWGQPSSRWILGVEWLSRVLYPQAFGTEPFLADVAGFFVEMYGLDRQRFESEVLPTISPPISPTWVDGP